MALKDLQNVSMQSAGTPNGAIVASGQLTGKIDTIHNVHYVDFKCATGADVGLTRAQLITDIAYVRAKLNGVVIFDLTATEVLDLFKWDHDANGALGDPITNLHVPFTRRHFSQAEANRAYALGMLGEDQKSVNVLTYEIGLTAGLVTLGKVNVYFGHDWKDPEVLGQHVRILSHPRTFAGTGDQDIVDLPRDKAGSALLAYHIHHTVGTMDYFSLLYNDASPYNAVPISDLHQRAREAGRTNQANYEHIPCDLQDDILNFLPFGPGNCYNLNLKPHWTVAPGSFNVIAEEIHVGLG